MGKSIENAGTRQVTRVPVTGLQFFWGICAIVGLLMVGWASLHADGAGLWFFMTHDYGALTITNDLLFIAIPVIVFMVVEARRLKMRWPWIWVPLIIPLPGAFVVPLFFLLRERALLSIRAGEQSAGGNPR
jgi:hypothetical protein